MVAKSNRAKRNRLQLKISTVLQALVESSGKVGSVNIPMSPSPHGDHSHVGKGIINVKDAFGVSNKSVWLVLNRKGFVTGSPPSAVLTELSSNYKTRLMDKILQTH